MESNGLDNADAGAASTAELDRNPGGHPGDGGARYPGPRFPITGPGGGAGRAALVSGASGGFGGPSLSEGSSLPTDRPNHGNRLRGEVVVLLPALNEARAIGQVIDGIPKDSLRTRGYAVSIWVVDGHSSDGTMDIARGRGAATFVQRGKGKGTGMRQAIEHILARPASGERVFVMLDADGTYPGDQIPDFVEALRAGDDVVLGSGLRGETADGAISDVNRLR